MEAREGIEPSHNGFADRRVASSPPRQAKKRARKAEPPGPRTSVCSVLLLPAYLESSVHTARPMPEASDTTTRGGERTNHHSSCSGIGAARQVPVRKRERISPDPRPALCPTQSRMEQNAPVFERKCAGDVHMAEFDFRLSTMASSSFARLLREPVEESCNAAHILSTKERCRMIRTG